jgi:Anti-sigma-28 factor, FlgM
MPKASLEELKGQIASGQYAVDPGALADDILSKFAVIRRVARRLTSEDEAAGGGAATSTRDRGSRPAPSRRSRSRDQRLS